ncbi:MAG: lipopolysaccharide biosynthesis protein RfbH [Rickettsiales bacterium]|nr:lipopolysaccharide biosynthesis protein RfbH [Rickettsiales bacterium]
MPNPNNKLNEKELLREKILDLTKTYVKKFGNNLKKSKNINVTGKVIDHEEVCNIVDSGLDMWLTAGRFNNEFERKLKRFIGVKYLLTCNSGSSANLIALSALCSQSLMGNNYIKRGSEVITCAVGFPTTINPILVNGLIPVFVDCELSTYNIDEKKIEESINHKTRAIMIAHTLGNPFALEKIKKICEKYNLFLVEDCCDALGSKYLNQHVGTFGDIGTLSFYPAHHITMGEGGAIFTNSSRVKRAMESIRDWGRDCWCETGCDNTCKKRFQWKFDKLPYGYDHKYIYSSLGYNLKVTDMQAAVGLAQLKKLDFFVKKRKENFSYLSKLLEPLSKIFILPSAAKYSDPSWFGFPLMIKNNCISRNSLINYLENNNIKTRLLFAGNIIKQPYMHFEKFKKVGDLKNANLVMNNAFWVGIYPGISKKELSRVSEIIHFYVNNIDKNKIA